MLRRDHDYLPFGQPLQNASDSLIAQRYGYTSREAHPASPLMYYRYRQYKPGAGRFAARDPSWRLDDAGTFSYARGNPVRYVDPKGADGVTSETLGWDDFKVDTTGTVRPPHGAQVATDFSWEYGPPVHRCEPAPKAFSLCAMCQTYGDFVRSTAAPTHWIKGRKPGPESRMVAGDECVYCVHQKPYFKALAKLLGAWVRPGMQSAALLKHERGHLKIAEVFADWLQIEMAAEEGCAYACDEEVAKWAAEQSWIEAFNAALRDARRGKNETDAQYDRDTNHGTNAGQQSAWDSWMGNPYGPKPGAGTQ